ncbi:MAG: hypothetical protein Kow00105_07770 [Phycisphaeraceae bacterium]
MDLDQTFSRIAFYQVLLGVLTFCYAEANPTMLLIAGSLMVLSRYVSEGPWGRPIPWWIINLLALLAAFWMIWQLAVSDDNIIVTMGHFTMWLQVLVMFARKSNRDYGQVLILSLIQMIGASVLSVSIIYGLLLGVYCVLAVLTILTFQLKSSRDRVYEAGRAAARDRHRVTRQKPVIGRGFNWQYRSVVTMILVICSTVAAGVFILIPRWADTTMSGETRTGLGPRRVGFSEQVRLDGPPIAQISHEPVMNVRIERFGEPFTTGTWLMRGAALDTYDPDTHTWRRSQEVASTDHRIEVDSRSVQLGRLPLTTPVIHARVTLRQIGHRNLFTILPVARFRSDSIGTIVFSGQDQQLSAGGQVTGAVIYDLYWPAYVGHFPDYAEYSESRMTNQRHFYLHEPDVRFAPETYARGWPIQTQRVARFTLNLLEEAGLSRNRSLAYDPNDEKIVRYLSHYLRENYTYRLSGSTHTRGDEPIIDFLFNTRTGHCELFASALAAMTRSIGMQTRVVTGFMAGEYNQIGGYFVVRQSDAHAWVEVNLGPDRGWRSFDPTPAAEIDRRQARERDWTTILREAYEHLEFGWIRSVVAYDVATRHMLLTNIGEGISSYIHSPDNWIGQSLLFVRSLPNAWKLDKVNTTKVLGSAALALLATIILIHRIIVRRRRMAILKLNGMPAEKQIELARHLTFFIEMNQILARNGYKRHRSQNPRNFAMQLVEEHPDRMAPVLALTDLFYRIRFGNQPLDHASRLRARVYLRQLDKALRITNE